MKIPGYNLLWFCFPIDISLQGIGTIIVWHQALGVVGKFPFDNSQHYVIVCCLRVIYNQNSNAVDTRTLFGERFFSFKTGRFSNQQYLAD